jgi:transcriptional regulator with XRE-family HTH domain
MVSKVDNERMQRTFAAWLREALGFGETEEPGRYADIGKRYGVTGQAVGKWLRGQSMPSSAMIGRIVEDLTGPLPGELPQEVESALRYLAPLRVAEEPTVSFAATAAPYVRLPRLAMEGGMGIGTEISDAASVVDYIDVAKWWAETNLPRPYSRIKIITGTGDSNAPLINHEDIVFVDEGCNAFNGPGLYVFNWQGRALIKRLTPNLRTNGLSIVSANPAYPPEEITLGEIDQLHIAGRVVAWYTLKRH